MSIIKKHLHSILNAKTSRVYALHEDEETALLSTIRDISCQVHEEAGKTVMPYELGEPFLVDYEPVSGSPFVRTSRRASISQLVHTFQTASYVSYLNRLIVTSRKLVGSVADMLRPRKSTLQEEEEIALFSTIAEVSREVCQEAKVCGIFPGGRKALFMAACDRPDEEVEKPAPVGISPAIKDALSEMVLWRKTQKMARQPWAIIDMYDEYMQEDLTLIGRIMDRNRSVKQAFINAHSAAY